jgi:hypothetical protein
MLVQKAEAKGTRRKYLVCWVHLMHLGFNSIGDKAFAPKSTYKGLLVPRDGTSMRSMQWH